MIGVEVGLRVRLAGGPRLAARRILVATGLRDELPEIPGVPERWGRDVLHCPHCHGYEVRDQPLGVLAGTPDAVDHALLVRQWSPDVALFPHTHTLAPDQREQLTARGIRIIDGTVSRRRIHATTRPRREGVPADWGTGRDSLAGSRVRNLGS